MNSFCGLRRRSSDIRLYALQEESAYNCCYAHRIFFPITAEVAFGAAATFFSCLSFTCWQNAATFAIAMIAFFNRNNKVCCPPCLSEKDTMRVVKSFNSIVVVPSPVSEPYREKTHRFGVLMRFLREGSVAVPLHDRDWYNFFNFYQVNSTSVLKRDLYLNSPYFSLIGLKIKRFLEDMKIVDHLCFFQNACFCPDELLYASLLNALVEFGRIRNLKIVDTRSNGKSLRKLLAKMAPELCRNKEAFSLQYLYASKENHPHDKQFAITGLDSNECLLFPSTRISLQGAPLFDVEKRRDINRMLVIGSFVVSFLMINAIPWIFKQSRGEK